MATRYGQARKIDSRLIVFAPYNGTDQRDLGVFPQSTEITLSAEKIQHGDGPVAAGVATREDVTLTRPFTEFSTEQRKWIEAHHGYPISLIQSHRGDDDLPIGEISTYTGVVGGAGAPEGDETSSDRPMLSVTLFLNTPAS